jgi:hypothetical protein
MSVGEANCWGQFLANLGPEMVTHGLGLMWAFYIGFVSFNVM